MFGTDRNEIRNNYFAVWKKHHDSEALTDLEKQILAVLLEHPEYHYIFNDRDKYLDKDYTPEHGETNPYLHMSLHLAIRDQVSTNRPQGVAELFGQLTKKLGDPLEAEHTMLESLMGQLWAAMQKGVDFDNESYLEDLRKQL